LLLSVWLLCAGGCRDGDEKVRLVQMDYNLLYHLADAELWSRIPGISASGEGILMREVTIEDDTRAVLFMHPLATVTYRTQLMDHPVLCFGIGLLPAVWEKEGDGVTFSVYLRESRDEKIILFQKHVSPADMKKQQGWIDEEIDLKPYEGQEVDLVLEVSAGSSGDARNDHAVWSNPVIRQQSRISFPRRKAAYPGIVLITADTLRADYLGCYGNERVETPTLDRLSKEGVLFEQVYTAANITNPAHISILTSLFPRAHGIYTNMDRLDDQFTILSQILQKHDYYTGAILSAPWLSHGVTGLNRGFDEFHEATYNKRAGITTAEAIEFVTKNRGETFFLWLHYFDPHTRYDPPSPFSTRYSVLQKSLPGEKTLLEKHAWLQIPALKEHYVPWLENVTDEDYPVGQYCGEIAYMDSELKKLLDRLKTLEIDKETMVVFTADHGEALGEHDIYYDHRGLWEPSVRIPLIIRYPDRLPEGKRVSSPVRCVDIMPTIMDLSGIPLSDAGGIEGVSLVPLIQGKATGDSPIVSEHAGRCAISICRGNWKLIDTYNNMDFLIPGKVLYNLETDPEEQVNLYDKEPDIAAELERELEAWWYEKEKGSPAPGEISERMRDNLKAMGYLE